MLERKGKYDSTVNSNKYENSWYNKKVPLHISVKWEGTQGNLSLRKWQNCEKWQLHKNIGKKGKMD